MVDLQPTVNIPSLSGRNVMIALGVSIALHVIILIWLTSGQLLDAQEAGGGASFGLGGGNAQGTTQSDSDGAAGGAFEAESSELDAQDESQAPDVPTTSDPIQATNQTAQPVTPSVSPQARSTSPEAYPRSVSSQTQSATRQPTRTPNTSSNRTSSSDNSTTANSGSTGGSSDSSSPASGNTQSRPQAKGGSGNERATGTGTSSANSGAGNAALTNYGGKVLAHIRRKRRSNNTGSGGRTLLRLTIAPNGELRAASIDRASSSRRFDQYALRTARQAAPYPAPPPGISSVRVWITGS